MNFQAYLVDTYRIIKEEPVILILGGLVVQLLTMLSMGILAGPFLGGYILLIIYFLRDNKKPSFNDIFSGLQEFGKLFPYFLVLLLIIIGFMLLILPGFLFATWWLYVLPLMVDRKISFSEAMRISMNKVNETGFLMHLVFLLLISVIPIMLLNFLSAMIPFLFVLKFSCPHFRQVAWQAFMSTSSGLMNLPTFIMLIPDLELQLQNFLPSMSRLPKRKQTRLRKANLLHLKHRIIQAAIQKGRMILMKMIKSRRITEPITR